MEQVEISNEYSETNIKAVTETEQFLQQQSLDQGKGVNIKSSWLGFSERKKSWPASVTNNIPPQTPVDMVYRACTGKFFSPSEAHKNILGFKNLF